MKSFGRALKEARISKKVTLRELGACVGKSIGYLSDIENERKRPPSLDVVEKMEECLEIQDNRLINLAARQRRKVSRLVSSRLMKMPNLSEALLRADEDFELTEEEFKEVLTFMENIRKKRRAP